MQAGVDVPRAAPHVLETHRLERQLLGWTAGNRVEADVRQLLVEPAPRLATTLGVHDARRVVGEAGGEALRLDSVPIGDSTSVASAIGSGWIDGLKTTAIEPMQIGGLEAATAVAQGEQWSFRLGAVGLNGRLYRLIFAAHTLSPAVDSRFIASLQSFHLLNAQDSALAAAQRIRIVEAGSGDTSETMAARMAFVPHALDQFLILNGLERDVPLVAGQRYKIIAE